MRLCLVEDDQTIGEAVRSGFRSYGFMVDWVEDGDAAEHALGTNDYWAVLLDLGLPGKSGLEVLSWMRGRGNDTPVIILSARDAVQDRIAGLDCGADDYLPKPFDLDELAARLRAVRRRREGRASVLRRYGQVVFDPARQVVTYRGKPVNLRGRELAFLAVLLEEPGKVLSRDQLIDRVYGWDVEIESNAVEFHVHALRRKLSPDAIRNIRGVGYFLADEPAD
ncbi:response regulator transcription factor [Novosphingobium resinovorum]|uniref:response regulator transcription factor n=1 Tax=Sphingomonadaceae TaxID=41297 RepID=UPI00027C9F67|nr:MULTISPECIES: response regulator transcription factor [Sphingomonadaceae]EJU12868.1 two-component system response regulator [Sphingomonas sp. LH128]MBF7014475.1 response regulator transcription factor [Novosphingobium sp. HR1a]WJM25044.1 response regulator transcription factor [Novosphingobium resinovorum]